jgi:hypothetical protein
MERYTFCREIFTGLNMLPVPSMYMEVRFCYLKITVGNSKQNTTSPQVQYMP